MSPSAKFSGPTSRMIQVAAYSEAPSIAGLIPAVAMSRPRRSSTRVEKSSPSEKIGE